MFQIIQYLADLGEFSLIFEISNASIFEIRVSSFEIIILVMYDLNSEKILSNEISLFVEWLF